MGEIPNPFDWQSHNPRVELPRPDVERLAKTLARGGSAVLLGGRGMGKSVTLQQIRRVLEEDGSTRVVLIPSPPPELTVRACLDRLALHLKVATGALDSRMLIDAYLDRRDVPQRLVLLFDEFDRYAEKGEPSATPPGRGFFNDLEATRRDVPGLGVMAAGSLGVFVVRDILGSSFLSRALHVRLRPFELAETAALARPFAERGQPLGEPVLDVLQLATGGIPALLTFGLQELWQLAEPPTESDVTAVYSAFSRDHAAYLQDLMRSVTDPRLSEAPRRVLDHIRQTTGRLKRSELEAVMTPTNGPLALELIDVLQLLEASGLIHVDGSLFHDNPVRARPITSLLDLPERSGEDDRLAVLLRRDLTALLAKLHRGSVDFFRPGRGGSGKQMVPESVFSAHLALGFELMGWQVERESQSAAGRTDLKLRRNGSPETVLVEVKIWGRNDYRDAQRQIESYWTTEISSGAVVQIADVQVDGWGERYRRECLAADGLTVEVGTPEDGSPISVQLTVTSAVGAMPASVEHFLLRLPRK